MSITLSELKSLLDPFPDLANARKWSPSRDWTSELKRGLCELAKAKGYSSCASIDNAHYGEWLYDVVWLKTEGGPRKTTDVLDCALVAESEWGNVGDIRDDFQKLLLAKADVRLMVYQASHADGFAQIQRQLAEQISKFRKSEAGEKYLFACFLSDPYRFEYAEYTVGG